MQDATYIKEQLCRITDIAKLDDNFGEPFIKAFSIFMPNEREKVIVASYTCSLFLSSIFNGFPTNKLHTFVHFTKEHFSRFSFNCKMYDSIFTHMNDEDLNSVVLFNEKGSFTTRKCSKQDIFEAFDFYTNN